MTDGKRGAGGQGPAAYWSATEPSSKRNAPRAAGLYGCSAAIFSLSVTPRPGREGRSAYPALMSGPSPSKRSCTHGAPLREYSWMVELGVVASTCREAIV